MHAERVSPDFLNRIQNHLSRVAPVTPPEKALNDLERGLHRFKRKGEAGKQKPVREVPFSGIKDAESLDNALSDPGVVIVLTWQEEEQLMKGLARNGVHIDSLPQKKYKVLPRREGTGHVDRIA